MLPKRRRRCPLLILIPLLAASAALWNLRQQQFARAKPAAASTAKVFRGLFERSIRATGSSGARSFAAIVAPRQSRERGLDSGAQMVIVQLAEPGTLVKKGDAVAQFDMQQEIDHIDDVKAQVVQLRAAEDKRRAEISIEMEAFFQQLRAARAGYEKARLDLRTAEVRSAIDAEKLQLAVEETAARYRQLEGEAGLRKLAQQADLQVLALNVKKEQDHVSRHVRNIERSTLRAPIDGLVVMQSINRMGQIAQVQPGDQVAPGTYFMQIVDLSDMVFLGAVNQADIHSVALGQPVAIRFEAYPELVLPGRVTSIGAMAVSGGGGRGLRGSRETFVRQVPIRIRIEGRDPRVLPDLSASAEVQCEWIEDALQVPREAVIQEAGAAYVRVMDGDGFQTREVELGHCNNTHFVVTEGLSEGEEVALR